MVNYMLESHGNWFTTKFKDPVTSVLNAEFTVRGIPKLVVMRKTETGEWTKVTEDGREIVQNNKENFKLANLPKSLSVLAENSLMIIMCYVLFSDHCLPKTKLNTKNST